MTKERPIIFNGEMVRAILEGRKTQTRRPIKPQPECVSKGIAYNHKTYDWKTVCPFGKVGDRLWVKEAFKCYNDWHYVYKADGEDTLYSNMGWTPSIHMRKEDSRITLEITNVRVERVKEITEEDAVKEGFADDNNATARGRFSLLWDSIYGTWGENPYVWVIEFRRVKP